MKNLLFLLVLITAALAAGAQTDTISITLKAKHHAYINALTPDKGSADVVSYNNQVARALTLTTDSLGRKIAADTAQLITVTVKEDLVARLYLAIGSQQERLTAVYNDEIKRMLIPQIITRPALFLKVMAITSKNASDTEELVKLGFNYFIVIK